MTSIELRYFGHAALSWTTPSGVRIVIDPWDNSSTSRWFLREFPEVKADLVLVTHAHFDHDAVDRVTGRPSIARHPMRLLLEDVSVQGFLDEHAPGRGNEIIPNTIYMIEIAGVRFCHVGDNRAEFPTAADGVIGRPDVLFVPVDDSGHILTAEEADFLVNRLNPRVIIPTHYFIEGLTAVESTLKAPDEWLARQPNKRWIDSDSITFGPGHLPARREVWIPRPQPI